MCRYTVQPDPDAIALMDPDQRRTHWYQCWGVAYTATPAEIAARIADDPGSYRSRRNAELTATFFNLRAPFPIARVQEHLVGEEPR